MCRFLSLILIGVFSSLNENEKYRILHFNYYHLKWKNQIYKERGGEGGGWSWTTRDKITLEIDITAHVSFWNDVFLFYFLKMIYWIS